VHGQTCPLRQVQRVGDRGQVVVALGPNELDGDGIGGLGRGAGLGGGFQTAASLTNSMSSIYVTPLPPPPKKTQTGLTLPTLQAAFSPR
jgi:hypothetical protein